MNKIKIKWRLFKLRFRKETPETGSLYIYEQDEK